MVMVGGDVFRPDGVIERGTDIAVRDGRIEKVQPGIGASGANKSIDATGLLVVPGLIDMHAHLFHGTMLHSTDPDFACLPFGVTTAVDMGTSGCHIYGGLRRSTIDRSQVRVLAFLNLGATGFATLPAVGEIADERLVRVKETVEVAQSDKEHIRGIKMRFSKDALEDNDGPKMLNRALEIANGLGLPLMVHIAECPIPISSVLKELRPGDFATHVFHGGHNGILDASGRVFEEVHHAAERGVNFDVGYGGWHFDIEVARAGFREGIVPTTLSTDAWAKTTYEGAAELPLYSLPDLVSQFVAIGMALEEALNAVTLAPARALGLASEIGALQSGAAADIAVYRRTLGSYTYTDRAGHALQAELVLEPVLTVRGGETVSSSLPAYPYTKPRLHGGAMSEPS